MADRPDLDACPRCGSTDRSLMNRECVRVSTIVPRVHPWHSHGDKPSSTPPRTDLAALADRLDWQAEQWEALGPLFDTAADTTAERTAARILRAVAAARRRFDNGESEYFILHDLMEVIE